MTFLSFISVIITLAMGSQGYAAAISSASPAHVADSPTIPNNLHYIWFGGAPSDTAKRICAIGSHRENYVLETKIKTLPEH